MASKDKGIADSSGKRKRGDEDDNGGKGRRNRSVLQFFEDAAVEDGDGDSDSGSDDFFNEDFFNDYNNMDAKVKNEPGRFDQVPFLPKEEELSGDELEKMLEERYRRGSGYVKYADEDYESKRSVDKCELLPSGEPTIWKVKCKVGREKNTVFCLIQKFVDLKVLGTKLQIISAFAVEHIKGFVFVEAERQSDVVEACNQLADVYFSLVTKVPSNEVGQLLVVKKRYNEVKEGTWARVKNGIYRGDLAQVVAVNNERKKATVKLIPRIDLQALTEKYGGGASSKRTKGSVPAARLISSSDLEEFQPLIQYRRDRDTGKMFEFLDSLMLKDGFLYKKVSIDSLCFWAVNPSDDELQKFTVSCNDESDNMEWLSQLYGEPKKRSIVNIDKGGGKEGGKGEGSSGSHEQSSFEVHDLVHFGKRDFGMVVGMEKDESYKILKDCSGGPVTLNLGQKDLKYVPLEKKFTALDHRMKTISINDTVRILEGPIKGRQGIVKQVYRGVIFLYDENDLANAYFCSKSQMSEKVKHSETACRGKDEGGPASFEDVPSSPKSPLSPKKPWQRGNNSDDRMEKDGIFSVGQSLRIRIGPLKGYLCRVLAVRYSDVTVKLDSQHKVLTVKREHLSEVRGKNSASSIRDDPETSSPFKPFDLLGTEGNTNDWLQQASGSADGDGWNVGGTSGDRGAWPAFPSSGASLQASTAATDLPTSAEDTTWLSKVFGHKKSVDNSDQVGGWGTSAGGWEKAKVSVGDQGSSWNTGGCSSGQGKADNVSEADPWKEGQKITSATNSWGSQSAEKGQPDSWDKGKRAEEQGGWNNIGSCGDSGSSGWGKQKTCTSGTWGEGTESIEQSIGEGGGAAWAEPKCSSDPAEESWGKAADGWGKKNNSSESSRWGNSAAASQSQAVALVETHTGWGQRKGQIASVGWKKSLDAHPEEIQTRGTGANVSETWTNGRESENKGSDVPCDDPWGKVVNKLGDKDSSNKGNEWGSSTNKNKGWGTSSRGWTNSQEQNTEAGGWKSSVDGGAGDGWSKSAGFGADNKGENNSWGQSKNFEDNRGFSRGRGPSGRGRGRGRDQFGRGRGRSFDRDQFSGSNKDSQGSFSSGNKDWKDQYGSSGGNSSMETGLTSSWGKGKSWNDNMGDGCKGWNKSSESDKDAGGWSSEKSNQTGWNGASSGSTGWGTSYLTSEEKAVNGWKKNATSTSSDWKKGGDASQGKSWGNGSEGRESWSKPAGNNSWEKPKNSENDQELGWGQGSGGRRGGRSFRGGRDQFGSGGGGRSGGRGGRNSEGSSWSKGGWNSDKTFGENNVGGNSNKSWGSDDGAEGKGWSKAGEGGSSWGSGSNNQKGGWDNDTSRNTGGGSSWGKPPSGHSSGAGGWSTDRTIGENSVGGNSNKSRGSDDREEGKGWNKAEGEGGSSWGSGSNNQKGGWDSNLSKNTGQDRSSWGKSSSGPSSDAGGWGKSSYGPSSDAAGWGKSSSGPSSDAGGWGKSSSGPSGYAGGWGKSSSGPSSDACGWGKSSSGPSSDAGGCEKSSFGPSSDAGGWGKSSSGPSSDAGGWGKSSSGPSSDAGGWGK